MKGPDGKFHSYKSIFLHSHQRSDETFVDKKSEKVYEEVRAKHARLSQDLEGCGDVIDDQMYVEAAGRIKKGKIYGTGSQASIILGSSSATSSVPSIAFGFQSVLNGINERSTHGR